MLKMSQIREAAAYEANPCVSIYMPTHRMGRETRQDPIRLENLVGEGQDALIAEGMRRPDAEALLSGVWALTEDYTFWQHQSAGLAIFAAPDRLDVHRLPQTMPEEVRVGVRFHVKHLLPTLANNGRFFVLTVAQDRVCLFGGGRHGLHPVEADEIPDSIDAQRGMTDYQEKVGFHPTGPTPTTHGTPTAHYHAGGEAPEDVRENQLDEWLHRVATGVEKALGEENAPLVVAADERNQGRFRTHSRYRHLVEGGIYAHPESLDEAELHRRAWELVEPLFARRLKEACDHYAALAGEGNERAPHDVPTVVQAARHGRVDVLFVAEDDHVEGVVDPDTGRGKVRRGGDHEDLLDRAVAEALATGAEIFALPKDRMPGGHAAAAILRY